MSQYNQQIRLIHKITNPRHVQIQSTNTLYTQNNQPQSCPNTINKYTLYTKLPTPVMSQYNQQIRLDTQNNQPQSCPNTINKYALYKITNPSLVPIQSTNTP